MRLSGAGLRSLMARELVTTWIDVPRALIQYTAVANVSEERYQKDCIEREF